MITTISKGKLFTVTTAVDEGRLKALKKAPELLIQALQDGADYWHSGVLPKHFAGGSHMKYGYAARTIGYLKARGGGPDLVQSGSLKRDVQARASITNTRESVSLKMFARVLNLAPTMPENSADLYVKHSNTKKLGYPNLKRELKLNLEDEREAVAQVVAQELEKYFGDSEGRESDD